MIEKNNYTYSVSEISDIISNIIKSNLQPLSVTGEITDLSITAKGHVYFKLKDENAVINVVCFAGIARNINIKLTNGLHVNVFGEVKIYKGSSSYQIQCLSIKPIGIGRMMQIIEETKRRLAFEGVFDQNKKQEIPRLPSCIGIITSKQGAAIYDVMTKLKPCPIKVQIVNTLVQGQDAVGEIIDAIKLLNQDPKIQTIIITRGGGSMEDLFCFNNEKLVMAIFESKKPVISAVGHEIDFTLCDLVADMRLPTPTAVGNFYYNNFENFKNNFNNIFNKIDSNIRSFVGDYSAMLEMYKPNIFATQSVKLLEASLNAHSMQIINACIRMNITNYNAKIENIWGKFRNIISQKIGNIENNLIYKNDKLKSIAEFIINRTQDSVKHILSYKYKESAIYLIDKMEDKLSNINSLDIKSKAVSVIENLKYETTRLYKMIKLSDHNIIMSKGYSVIRSGQTVLKHKSDIKDNDIINIDFQDDESLSVRVKIEN
jgi:exodeoxyribonuclease VII large subunit